MRGGPDRILARFLSTRGQPLLQRRNLFPQSVAVNLTAEAQLGVKAAALGMFLHNVFPQETNAPQAGSLIGTHVQREVIARGRDETPVGLAAAGDQEFVSRTAEVGCDGVRPLGRAGIVHLKVDLVLVEGPSLVGGDVQRFQLPRVRRQVRTLVDVNGGGLRRIGDEEDGAEPDAPVKVHIRVAQVRSEIDAVGGGDFVQIDPAGRRGPGKAGGPGGGGKTHDTRLVESGGHGQAGGEQGLRLEEEAGRCQGILIVADGRRQRRFIQVERRRAFGEFPLRRLCVEVDIIVLTRVGIHVSNPTLGQGGGRRRRRVDVGGLRRHGRLLDARQRALRGRSCRSGRLRLRLHSIDRERRVLLLVRMLGSGPDAGGGPGGGGRGARRACPESGLLMAIVPGRGSTGGLGIRRWWLIRHLQAGHVIFQRIDRQTGGL
jgi:hypothetical protein